jgi:hypothetical protein
MKTLAGIMCLAFVVTACDTHELPLPTNPVAPTTPAAPTVPTTVTLSGVVTEDGRPIANARVEISTLQACTPPARCTTQSYAGAATTDASGRYTLARIPEGATAWAIARREGYVQQCAANVVAMHADANLDLKLTSTANLSTAHPISDPGLRTVSGAVVEATPTGKQLVQGAWVGWEALLDTVVAETTSDAAGRYLLCGLPRERISGLFAYKQGYAVDYVSVQPGGDAIVEIEVTRR